MSYVGRPSAAARISLTRCVYTWDWKLRRLDLIFNFAPTLIQLYKSQK